MLRLNVDKSKVLFIGLRNTIDFTYYLLPISQSLIIVNWDYESITGKLLLVDWKATFQNMTTNQGGLP